MFGYRNRAPGHRPSRPSDEFGPPNEQTVPAAAVTGPPAHVLGDVHENRYDLNGFRSIADRGLLFDAGGSTITNALNYGGTVGYQGVVYQLYNTSLQADMVHVGN